MENIEYSPMMMRDLPTDLRPRERLISAGANALSEDELLAIMLRVGRPGENAVHMAQRILSSFDGLPGLAQATIDELCSVDGIGMAKAAQIKASLEMGKRLMATIPKERLQVRSPSDVANLLMVEMSFLDKEELHTVLLDTKNFIIRTEKVYAGSLNSAVVRVGEVFREAIRANCASIIVAHNHPSGDPTPSPEDVHVTKQIVEAGELLDINVLDHLVIGRSKYVSLNLPTCNMQPATCTT